MKKNNGNCTKKITELELARDSQLAVDFVQGAFEGVVIAGA